MATNVETISKVPTSFEPKRLKPKLNIVEKPENRVQVPYSRVSPRKTNVGSHSHLCKFAGKFFVNASRTVKILGHGTGTLGVT